MKKRLAIQRRHLAALALAVITILLAGCSAFRTGNQGSGRTAVVVLFDVSGSTLARRQQYYDDFCTIVDSLGDGETIIGDIATENTAATASYPIRETFPKYDPLVDNPSTYKKKVAAIRARVLDTAKNLLSQTKSDATDLLSAPLLVDKVINGEETRDCNRKLLVFFTDGFQQTSGCDFSKVTLNEKRIDEIIMEEKAAQRFPNLKEVDVWIVGAAASVKVSQAKMQQLQAFWLRYFSEAGAHCSTQQYATTLINFNLRQPIRNERVPVTASSPQGQPNSWPDQTAEIPPAKPLVKIDTVAGNSGRDAPVNTVEPNIENHRTPEPSVPEPGPNTEASHSGQASSSGHLQATSNADVATLLYRAEGGVERRVDCSPDSDMLSLRPGRYHVRIVGSGGRIIARGRSISIVPGRTVYLGPDPAN